MAKGIVVYYSRSGNTRQMAKTIAEAMDQANVSTDCKSVDQIKAEDLLSYDAIVLGSPTYFGQMAAPLKQLVDELVNNHGLLDGKVGGVFSTSANLGGGNETTAMGLIQALLIAGLIVQGDPKGDHYGPVAIGKPDERAVKQCTRRGQRIAELTKRLFD